MRKTLGKVVLAVVIAGLLTGGIAIASAATKVRTVTTAQGTTVDIIAVTGTVTEVSTPASSTTDQGFLGMFRHGREGYAKVKDSADGTVYTIELGPGTASGIVMKVGDTVTVEGDVVDRGGTKELHVWTFTGADGKTVTLRKDDGTPNVQTVTVSGTVTEVSSTGTSTGTDTKPERRDLDTVKVKQADGTVVSVVLGHENSTIVVKVGDTVTVEGFSTPGNTGTVMATSFTGADGKTISLRSLDDLPGERGGLDEASVTVKGTVTEVSTATPPSAPNGTVPSGTGVQTIKVKQADGTVTTVVLGPGATTVAVKVGDTVTVVGFARPSDSTTVVARSFTGADGTTVTLGGRGPRGRGMGDGGCFGGRGPRDGEGSRGPAPDATANPTAS